MSTGKRTSDVKLIGVFIIIAGALVVVAAGVTLGMASSQLKAGHMSVTTVTSLNKPASDPLNAYVPGGISQQNSKGVTTISDTRDSMTNGSFLRALFVTAAVAFGIAAPVMGIGVLFALVDFGPLRGSRRRRERARTLEAETTRAHP
jgi:ABC-type sugar transport system permease subunit